jgi:hypothetical protein
MSKLTIKELDRVVLTAPLPAHGLKVGDVGVVVDVYRGGEGFEVEFCTLTGETIVVATVEASQVRSVEPREVASARRLAG